MVTPREYPNLPARYLRREVDLPAAPRRALLCSSGLGRTGQLSWRVVWYHHVIAARPRLAAVHFLVQTK